MSVLLKLLKKEIKNVKKIYKFLTINEFSRDVMLTKEFYFADWEKMNDPMEGYFEYNPDETIQHNLDDIKNAKNG